MPDSRTTSARKTRGRSTRARTVTADQTPIAWRLTRRLAVPVVLFAVAALCTPSASGPSHGASAGAPAGSRLASWADGTPFGDLDSFYIIPGGEHVWGWDIEPDAATTPVRTYGTVDGHWAASLRSDHWRPDVAAAHPNSGGHHGIGGTIPVPEGRHTVCVKARNIDAGSEYTLGCRTRTFDYGPVGDLIGVTSNPGALHVRGWDMDADDAAAALRTTVTVDGVAHVVTANVSRPVLSDRLPGAGPDHGFSAVVPAAQGPHRVCVTAGNVGYGTDTGLGCVSHTLDESPQGALDPLTTADGRLHVTGWAVDPDSRSTAARVTLRVDGGAEHTVSAGGAYAGTSPSGAGDGHGFDTLLPAAEGAHQVCATARNVSYGGDTNLGCQNITLSFTPSADLFTPHGTATGVALLGWAGDPDTTSPVRVQLLVDGRLRTTVLADRSGLLRGGHRFAADLPLTSGSHTVCAVTLNAGQGTRNSPPSCRTITLALSPLGGFGHLIRASAAGDLRLVGWALDPDTTAPIVVAVSVDGTVVDTVRADARRTDVGASYPGMGDDHGVDVTITADAGEHRVCLTARNVSGGADTAIGCRQINAVRPLPPGAPQDVAATPGYGSATVRWSPPTSDGGAPVSGYMITAHPGMRRVQVTAGAGSAAVTGLRSGGRYVFTVRAVNVAGAGDPTNSAAITTPSGPAAQTTPAPVSTSRYIRNVHGSTSSSLAAMRSEGAADAAANPAGHRYLVLLDIGGQDEYDGGVVLSAGVRYVSYGDLVRDLEAYVDGYRSTQRSGAPVTVALGTNNDMDVSTSSGASWADHVVDPVRSHASGYPDMTIAGADDFEPGFTASYSASSRWLTGYLGGTSAQFVFNGSADGCAWTRTDAGCNNGWTMSGLYRLAAGAAASRIVNLPQIYNTTMAAQWKYISLTGIGQGSPRINFGGPLTEWTACDQAGSCGSLTGRTAWQTLWNDLQSDSRLRPSSLPYSTDLRIDSG